MTMVDFLIDDLFLSCLGHFFLMIYVLSTPKNDFHIYSKMCRYGRTVNSLKPERKIRPINKARKEEQGLYQKPGLREANAILSSLIIKSKRELED